MPLSAVALVGALEAVCGLFFIIGLGYGIARVGWLSQTTKKELGQLLISVFIPALVFTSMSQFPFETGGGVAAGPVCLFAGLHTVLGAILGVVLGWWAGKTPREFRKLVLAMCTYGNSGNLPVAIVQTLAINGLGAGNVAYAVAFASLYYSVRQVIMWTTWRCFIVRPDRARDEEREGALLVQADGPDDDYPENEEAVPAGDNTRANDNGSPGTLNNELEPLADTAEAEEVSPDPAAASPTAPSTPTRCSRLRSSPCCVRARALYDRVPIARYMPIIAALSGLIIAAVDPIEDAFTLKDGSVHFVFDSMHMVGSVSSPAILLLLGASLWQPAKGERSRLSRRTLAAVILTRLVFLPLLSLGLVRAMWREGGGFLMGDRALAMVLLVHGTMPTAMNVNLITQESGFGEAELGHAMAVQYLAFLAAIPVWLLTYSATGLI